MSSTAPQPPHSSDLLRTLLSISQNPSPHVPNPPSCSKRASVALVLRIRPHSSYPPPSPKAAVPASTPFTTATSSPTALTHPPPGSPPPPSTSASLPPSTSTDLTTFFSNPWVLHGDPEVLFIKRASRSTDRWSSHVALPGGRRDPEDEDDKTTAVRETWEEIGLDLKVSGVLFVGKLPERVVSTNWGKVPIMVLCPFIFLLTTPNLPRLNLQPTEIFSLHCVPLRTLLSPSLRTYEYVEVANRFASRAPTFIRSILSLALGKMRFSAVHLLPSESHVCTETQEYFSNISTSSHQFFTHTKASTSPSHLSPPRPLHLWGLTLGILADFLDQLPPHNAISLWSYPTFTAPDVRFLINVLTLRLKAQNNTLLQNAAATDPQFRRRGSMNQTAVDADSEAVALDASKEEHEPKDGNPGDDDDGQNPWFIGGLSKGLKAWSEESDSESGSSTTVSEPSTTSRPLGRRGSVRQGSKRPQAYAVGVLMNGYYDMARKGVWIALCLRTIMVLVFGWALVRRYHNSRWRNSQT